MRVLDSVQHPNEFEVIFSEPLESMIPQMLNRPYDEEKDTYDDETYRSRYYFDKNVVQIVAFNTTDTEVNTNYSLEDFVDETEDENLSDINSHFIITYLYGTPSVDEFVTDII